MKNIQPTIKTGAMTLVLLVKYYRSQMIALLLKNGVTVPNRASNEEIASLMANLLKISKSFFTDLNNFLQNPNVLQVIAGGMSENAQYFRASGSNFAGKREGNAQYFRASGNSFMNYEGEDEYDDAYFDEDEDPALPTPSGTPKKGFFSGLNFGDLFNKALVGFGKYDKNQTDKEIARAAGRVGGYTGTEDETGDNTGGSTGGGGGGKKTPDEGLSTTTIVILSLVGVAVIGTIIYFVARPKQ